ncbi:MAG: radical SAM protein [Flavobacteriaceae bacterium]|nr:MAG: radical SAM protein [Flavobacteriaceae bacterium]
METQNIQYGFKRGNDLPESSVLVSESEKKRIRTKVFLQLIRLMNQYTKNPIKSLRLLLRFKKKYQTVFGDAMMSKIAHVDNRYYYRLGSPGFPSLASEKMFKNEISRLISHESEKGLRTLIMAITKKCPLKCEHCFEWNNLNQKEQLSTQDLIGIVRSYQKYGTTQIMFSGGEPMLRKKDIVKILDRSEPGTDFWVITSGLGLNKESAQLLKKHGLTGVMVSLDHHEAEKHNTFRGNSNAYQWAIDAVSGSREAGLVTALSLCATRSYIQGNNLPNYMDLAKDLGVSFVQLLEPRAEGRYQGQDVMLNESEIKTLDGIYLKYNNEEKYSSYPIINSLGYHQRKVGCFGGGNRFFYIDTDGDAHLCPYCVGKTHSVLEYPPEELIGKMKDTSCHVFENSVL